MGAGETVRPAIGQAVVDLLYLCGRAIAGEVPEPRRLQRMSLPQVHALAADQSLAALSFYALEAGRSALPDDVFASPLLGTWRQERDAAIRRQMLFSAERTQICEWLADAGIWHAPLKGAVLEGYYPRVGMREYSDNDILFDATRGDDVSRFFAERGYDKNADGFEGDNDDVFTKKPVYHFEMHKSLFSEHSSPELARYYETIHDRLVSTDGSPCRLRLSDEDECVYQIAHAHKHHCLAGTGVRVLCDLKVLAEHAGGGLDRGYIEHELQVLGMAEFGASLGRLAACVFTPDFNPAELADEDARMLFDLTAYGTFGTVDRQAELGVEREQAAGGSAAGYVRKRILPDDHWWEVHFPFAHEHKWARPPFFVYRVLRAAVSRERRRRIIVELRAVLRKAKGGSE